MGLDPDRKSLPPLLRGLQEVRLPPGRCEATTLPPRAVASLCRRGSFMEHLLCARRAPVKFGDSSGHLPVGLVPTAVGCMPYTSVTRPPTPTPSALLGLVRGSDWSEQAGVIVLSRNSWDRSQPGSPRGYMGA